MKKLVKTRVRPQFILYFLRIIINLMALHSNMYLFLLRTEKVQNMQKKSTRSFLTIPFFLSHPPFPPSLSPPCMIKVAHLKKKDFKKKIIKKTRSVQDEYYFIKCSKFELIFECFSPKVYLTSNRKFI